LIVYLDANIIIYLVENHPVWGPQVQAKLAQLRASGDQIASGDASRLECLVGPYLLGDPAILADYAAFFQASGVMMFPLTAAVCERAALIRASFNIKPLDALHMATAIEHGCGLFLTNDAQLLRCTQISVEVLT
jgi:predicted nucleic acid-binding protein